MRAPFLLMLGCVVLTCAGATSWAEAAGVYLSQDAFLARTFRDSPPQPRVLWIDAALREELTRALDHPPKSLRVRYWSDSGRSAWVLEEIGKDKPITLGIVIDAGAIESVDVLVFRESRGWEIRHPFFTNQFKAAQLEENGSLDRGIDGITGATLSVRATVRAARAALLLHRHAEAVRLPVVSGP